MIPRLAFRAVATLGLLAACTGCSSSTRPISEPTPNVSGAVQRQGVPAANVHVELRTPEGRLMSSTHTTAAGSYAIGLDAAGEWEIKAVGIDPDDFSSVNFDFAFQAGHPLVLPTLDIHAYGAAAIQPADSVSVPTPSPIQPLEFEWIMPARASALARVQCFDSTGAAVWYSNWVDTTRVLWNGLVNQGTGAGRFVSAGAYNWRMKFSFPDSSSGHTPYRRLTFDGTRSVARLTRR